jgi:carbon storage regulator
MLVLSRKIGEKIVIGHDVFLTILDVRGDSVKLGMDAPRSVSIHREEVYRDILEANQQALAGGGSSPPAKALSASLQKASQYKQHMAKDVAVSKLPKKR